MEVQPVPAEHGFGDGLSVPAVLAGGARAEPTQLRVPDVGGAAGRQVDVGAALFGAFDPDVAAQVEHFGAEARAAADADPRVGVLERCGQHHVAAVDALHRHQVVGGGEGLGVGRGGRGDGEFVARLPAVGGGGEAQRGVAGLEVGGGPHPGGAGCAVEPEVALAGDPQAGVAVDDGRPAAPEAAFVDVGEAQGVGVRLVGGEGEGAADFDVAAALQGERPVLGEDQRAAGVDQQRADPGVGVQHHLVGDPHGAARAGGLAAPALGVRPLASVVVDRRRGRGRLRAGRGGDGAGVLRARRAVAGRWRGGFLRRSGERLAQHHSPADRGHRSDRQPGQHPPPSDRRPPVPPVLPVLHDGRLPNARRDSESSGAA